jgi:hypothetical protein
MPIGSFVSHGKDLYRCLMEDCNSPTSNGLLGGVAKSLVAFGTNPEDDSLSQDKTPLVNALTDNLTSMNYNVFIAIGNGIDSIVLSSIVLDGVAG